MANEFDPTIHGFYFPNAFDNPVTSLTVAGDKVVDIKTGGRCGGMSYLALDYFTQLIHLPSCSPGDFNPASQRNPQDTSWLADTCTRRLLQSWSDCLGKWLSFFTPLLVSGYLNSTRDELVADFLKGAKLAGFTIPTPVNLAVARGYTPSGGAVAINKGEMATVRSVVSKTSPRPLGMVAKAKLTSAGDAHYVVAFDQRDSGSDFVISVWDCNFPGETMELVMDAGNPTVINERHAGQTAPIDTWEGFFVDESFHEVFPDKGGGLAYIDISADVQVPDTVKKGADLVVKVSLSNPSQFTAHLQQLQVVGDFGSKTLALPSPHIKSPVSNLTATIPNFSSSSGLKFISVRGVMMNAGTRPGFPLPTTGKKGDNALIPVTVVD